MKFLKGFFSVVLSIIMMVALFLAIYVRGFNNSVANKEVMADAIKTAGFNKEIKKTLDDGIKDYLKDTEKEVKKHLKENGVNLSNAELNKLVKKVTKEITDILNKFVSEENIDNVITKLIGLLYEKDEINLGEVLQAEITNFINEQNLEISDDTKKEIEGFANDLAKEINKSVADADQKLIKLNDTKTAIVNPVAAARKIFGYIELGLFVGALVLAIIVILINLKTINGVIHVCSATLLASLSVKIINGILLSKDMIDFGTDNIGLLIKNLINAIVDSTSIIANLLIVLVIVCLIITIILKIVKVVKEKKTA